MILVTTSLRINDVIAKKLGEASWRT